MPAYIEREGDILAQDDVDYLVHQGNCLTVRSHGLAKVLFAAVPHDDVYARREPVRPGRNLAKRADRDRPGRAYIGDRIITLFGQWRPGQPGASYWHVYPEAEPDAESSTTRLRWFREALADIAGQLGTVKRFRLAFPHGIGCGLAGGHWPSYRRALQRWVERHPNFTVIVCKLPSNDD